MAEGRKGELKDVEKGIEVAGTEPAGCGTEGKGPSMITPKSLV